MNKINIEDIRKYFPIYNNNKDLHYLDNAATSLKPACVIDAMNDYYNNYGVNIHRGVYKMSYLASTAYENAREKVAKFINAESREVVFCRNASEGLNQIDLMISKLLKPGDHILSTPLEHHSSILPWQNMAKEGICVDYIELDNEYRIRLENVIAKINDNTKVLAITYASNTMGYITDIKDIISYAHKKGILVVLDAAQFIPHAQVDVKDIDCDFLAFSGHKMFGPTGIGVFFGKYDLLKKLAPVYYGGDMNNDVDFYKTEIKKPPYCFETGTPAIAEAIGLAKAIEFIEAIGYDSIQKVEKELLDYAHDKLKDIDDVIIYNPNTDLGIINFNIKDVHPHDAATIFDNYNVALRAGHHCAQLVSRTLGVNGTLRASIYVYNTKGDIDALVDAIKETISFFKQF